MVDTIGEQRKASPCLSGEFKGVFAGGDFLGWVLKDEMTLARRQRSRHHSLFHILVLLMVSSI